MGGPAQTALQGANSAPTLEGDAAKLAAFASLFIDVMDPFSIAMCRHIHEHVDDLGGLEDAPAVEATRVSCEANMREIFSMLRAGLSANAHQTPVEALEYVRFFKSRGVGLHPILYAYQYGVAMFRDVIAPELESRVSDLGERAALAQAADAFTFAYIARVTDRLAAEFGLNEGWIPSADDAILANPHSIEAARKFRDEQMAKGQWLAATPEGSRARFEAERTLDGMAKIFEGAAGDPEVTSRLCLANTRITITLADEPDLSVTLDLRKPPVEVFDGVVDSDSHMWIASVDLNRMWSPDFHLPLAIANGRVRVSGPVRKFLRITPILREIAAAGRNASRAVRDAKQEGGAAADNGAGALGN